MITPWWMDKLHKFENVYIPYVDKLPEEASIEKGILQTQNIKSLLAVPMIYGKTLIGFLGFDFVRENKVWSDEIVALLRMAGEAFV